MDQFEMLKAWAETNVETTMFYILATLAIPLAYGVILDKTIIRSGFILIGVFGSICGLFLLLQAQFLALAQPDDLRSWNHVGYCYRSDVDQSTHGEEPTQQRDSG